MTTDLFIFLLIGILASIIGAAPFGLVNLSILQSAINKGTRSTFPVAHGASFVEVLYGVVGIFAGRFIAKHINENLWFHLISALILLITGVIFLFRKNRFQFSSNNTFGGFSYGILLNLLSLQVLAYWVIASGLLSATGYLPIKALSITGFLAGIWIGKISVLYGYAYFGEEIIGQSDRIARNINRLVGVVLMVAAGVVMAKGFI